jgi:hypothetical protein
MSSILKALRRVEQDAPLPAETALRDAVVAASPAASPAPVSPWGRGLRALATTCLLLLAAFGALRLVQPDVATAPSSGVSAAPPAPATLTASASEPSQSASTPNRVGVASTRNGVGVVWGDADDAPAVESAPAPRFDERAERFLREAALEPVLGEDESSVAVAEPLRVEERLAAQEARAAAHEAEIPAPPAPAESLRRSDVLAQPSPRRDLAAPRPSSALDAEAAFDMDTSSESVPIARRDRRPSAAAAVRKDSASLPRADLAAPSVIGTVWHPDAARRSARLRVAGDQGIRDVREGDRIGGWQVMRIDPSGVLLRRGELETLRRVGEHS